LNKKNSWSNNEMKVDLLFLYITIQSYRYESYAQNFLIKICKNTWNCLNETLNDMKVMHKVSLLKFVWTLEIVWVN
jgi:hypothetical protein